MPTTEINLDISLDRIEALLGLLSYLQDQCGAEERQRLANAEGYLVETLRRETASARQSFAVIWQARPANERRAG